MAYKGTGHAWLRNLGRLEEHANWIENPEAQTYDNKLKKYLVK